MNELKEKLKKIFMAIGAGIVSIGTFVLGIVIYNNGKSAGRAEDISDRLSDTTEGLSESGRKLSETNRRLDEANGRFADTNKRFGELLQEIEKTKRDN